MSNKQNNGNNGNQSNQNNGVKPAEKEDMTMRFMNFKERHPRLCKAGKIVGGAFIGIGSALGIYAGVDTYRRRTKKYHEIHEIGSLDILPDPGDPVGLMDDEEPKASAAEVLADEIEVTSF